MSSDVVVAGVGMHSCGKWGRNFVEYGVAAARVALADAGIAWRDVQFVSGADTMRNGYPGYVSGATFAQAMGWTGARVASSYAACASGVTALEAARTRILAGLCDVAQHGAHRAGDELAEGRDERGRDGAALLGVGQHRALDELVVVPALGTLLVLDLPAVALLAAVVHHASGSP